jgi:Pyridoxamine 5'-phosphate oxidase
MRWCDLERAQPKLAEVGRAKLGGPGVVLVATIRRDGSPRVSPVEPLFWRGDLWLSMGWRTRKTEDLTRDARILVHSIITGREGEDGEFKVRGTAFADDDADVQREYAAAVRRELGWQPEPGRFHLFRIELDDVTFIRWDSETNDQYVSRWPAGVEFVRRGTSATSLGEPERIDALLVKRETDRE